MEQKRMFLNSGNIK
uniref:Uncharacterized protein n=1 Tax=Arundo donax TaxID=35708 RepID=A0A0A9B595_ARUDO